MPYLQRGLTTVFWILTITVLIPSQVLADGIVLSPANSAVWIQCWDNDYKQSSTATSVTLEDDNSMSGDFTIYGWDEVQVVGKAATSLAKNPEAFVSGSAKSTTGNVTPPGHGVPDGFSGSAAVSYYMAVEETAPAPTQVAAIPMTMTWKGETLLEGLGTTSIYASFAGTAAYTPGAVGLDLVPGSQYSGSVVATCAALLSYSNHYSECQAVADPVFEFDQAAFDAQMGADTFPLADYYSFGFSPNLTATPEPSTLILFGSWMLCFAGVIRNKLR